MNGHPARLASTLALAFGLVTQGCNPKEAAPAPALISPDYTPLAAQICFDWLTQVREAQNRFNTQLSWSRALETCTENLAITANSKGWPNGHHYDSSTDQTVSDAMMVSVPIAGQVGLWHEDAEDLAQLIDKATPDE